MQFLTFEEIKENIMSAQSVGTSNQSWQHSRDVTCSLCWHEWMRVSLWKDSQILKMRILNSRAKNATSDDAANWRVAIIALLPDWSEFDNPEESTTSHWRAPHKATTPGRAPEVCHPWKKAEATRNMEILEARRGSRIDREHLYGKHEEGYRA